MFTFKNFRTRKINQFLKSSELKIDTILYILKASAAKKF